MKKPRNVKVIAKNQRFRAIKRPKVREPKKLSSVFESGGFKSQN